MKRALFLLTLLSAPAGAQEFETPASVDGGKRMLSAPLREALRKVQWEFAAVESGRRLMALTEAVPVVESRRLRGRPIRWVRGTSPAIAVDRERAKRLPLLDFEVLFFRARWFALADLPLDLLEAEYAVRQAVLSYALDKAQARPDFEKQLRSETARARDILRERAKSLEYAREHGEGGAVLFPGSRPRETLEGLAFDLYLYSEDPYLLYASLAADAPTAPRAVSLDAVEDFLTLHGTRLGEVYFRAGGRTALAGGRSYDGALARAALFVEDAGALAQLRERVGPYRGVEGEALAARINAWLRETP